MYDLLFEKMRLNFAFGVRASVPLKLLSSRILKCNDHKHAGCVRLTDDVRTRNVHTFTQSSVLTAMSVIMAMSALIGRVGVSICAENRFHQRRHMFQYR